MSDVMFLVAHSAKARGVDTDVEDLDEYTVSLRASLAAMRNLMGDFECELYDVGPIASAGAYLARKVQKVNGCKPMLAVEIHCNGANNTRADYREVIHWPGSERGEMAAEHVAAALTNHFPSWKKCNARANDPAMDKHWMYFLKHSDPPALIVEGLFLTNPQQREYIAGLGAEIYGLAVAEGVRNFLTAIKN